MSAAVKQKWAGQVKKGDVIVGDDGEYPVTKVESVFGGSWYEITVEGIAESIPVGGSEKVPVKA